MKAYVRVAVQFHEFFTSALAEGKWSASQPSCLTPGRLGRIRASWDAAKNNDDDDDDDDTFISGCGGNVLPPQLPS
jgi:hypothetical protein